MDRLETVPESPAWVRVAKKLEVGKHILRS